MKKFFTKTFWSKFKKLSSNKDNDLHQEETQNDEGNVVLSKKTSGVKITKKNVFDVLDEEGGLEIVVDRYIAKKLHNAAKRKRYKDEFISLKNSNKNIIEVQNVSKYYLSGNSVTKVLRNVSAEIKQGEFVMIFGKSGSGKSTLLNLISGLDRPSKGNVVVCDTNLPYLSDWQLTLFRRKHVSFIFQNYNLLQNLSGYDNVQTGAYLQKDKNKKLDIHELFSEFGMDDVKNKYPSQMSGGQQQRISILRALAKNSSIIFADEPTAALDEQTTQLVLNYLFEINRKYKTTIVMVTHNPHIANIASKIITVKNGKIKSVVENKFPKHPKDLEWKE
ncbi:ABC transporter ATP-binding protein [Mycoplasmopsis cynos]|uniref:ABC transporter ATP-binding protein n=1 Tax=Mycoplasmopsis cynos TaxID=171284 RepID=UPI002AFFF4EA|nr:ABC transporter ATP-binding protein [Mycoplasmopsis cynos]WQQ19495.1 ABC transporter ATP-binding protein [Mycoplasmopsis cynos]